MKLIEVTQPTPEVIRLFLDPRLQAGNFVMALVHSLGREKATNFQNVNLYLESSLGDANRVLEDMGSFQMTLEGLKGRGLDRRTEEAFEDLKARAQTSLVELHRAKIKLNDLKIALCRFIIHYEAPSRAALRPYHAVEEWMDAAALAEMRLTRGLPQQGQTDLQRLLALFMTFRSIVCSYDGPSMFIRQLENSSASLDALYDKVRLEYEVQRANKTLIETRRELSTAKINLSSLQNQLQARSTQAEQMARLMSLQEKPGFPKIAAIGLALGVIALAAGYTLLTGITPASGQAGEVISQAACRDIQAQLEKSPRYQSQVLIFRKFGHDVYFKANPITCEKLHRLTPPQMASLAELMKVDYAAGNQAAATFNGNRVLQVKDIGVNTMVVKLANRTASDLPYKVRVLELATTLKAILQPDPDGINPDLLIVDLPVAARTK
jgi:hypothetical protein